MSDSWQGPGWRRAADGKWYPEEQAGSDAPHPPPFPVPAPTSAGVPPPPPTPDGPPFGVLPDPPPPVGAGPTWGLHTPTPAAPAPLSATLAAWLQGLFWAVGAGALVIALVAVAARNAFDGFMSPAGGFDDLQSWQDADQSYSLVTAGVGLVQLALLVVMIVWSWKAHRAAASLHPGERTWRIGWTIGAWFIPCAALILPKLVLDETEKIASAPRYGGVATNWKGATTSLVGWAWWVLFVIANLLSVRVGFTDGASGGAASLDRGEIATYYAMHAIGAVIGAVSAVFGARYVRRISRLLGAESLLASGAGLGPLSGASTSPMSFGPTVAAEPLSSVDRWATATAAADGFCEICHEPLAAATLRCPRCGKRRQPTVSTPAGSPAIPGWDPSPPTVSTGAPPPPPPPPPPTTGWAPPPPPPAHLVPSAKAPASAARIIATIAICVLLVVVVCVAAVSLLGRSTTDDTALLGGSSTFTSVQEKAIVDSCVAGGGTRSQCQCVFVVITDLYTPVEYEQIDRAAARGDQLPAELLTAIQARCR